VESKLFVEDPIYATAAWYAERERAPHLEQGAHQWRLSEAWRLATVAVNEWGVETVSDLGAGDGGFLSTLRDLPVTGWGYDLQPSNIEGAAERGVDVRYGDFVAGPVDHGDLTVCTEVLEHLLDPHALVAAIPSPVLIASSPVNETAAAHYAFHLWAWDRDGYADLLTAGGYQIVEHVDDRNFQVILGARL
jgi:2-polyprenyl-3-methyl-5-hydroxy-6-metoxy-1,4-benzoquinol methylase